MAAPCDVRGAKHNYTAGKVEQHAEVAAVQPVDQHTANERNDKARKCDDDDLPAHLDGRVCGGKDVPAHTREVHAAAEQRDEHGDKEIAEGFLRPDEVPVDTGSGNGGGHG